MKWNEDYTKKLEESILQYRNDNYSTQEYLKVIRLLIVGIREECGLLVPVRPSQKDTTKDVMQVVKVHSGKNAYVAFTSREQLEYGTDTDDVRMSIAEILNQVWMSDIVEGVAINAFHDMFFLDRDTIEHILNDYLKNKREKNQFVIDVMEQTATNSEMYVHFTDMHISLDSRQSQKILEAGGIELEEKLKRMTTKRIDEIGSAVVTKGYECHAKYIVHVISESAMGMVQDYKMLEGYVYAAMESAKRVHSRSITFPLLSDLNLNFPYEEGMRCLLRSILQWEEINRDYHIDVLIPCDSEEMKNDVTDFLYDCQKEVKLKSVSATDQKVQKAMQFVTSQYAIIPEKVNHFLETYTYLCKMNVSKEVMIAGLLHEEISNQSLTSAKMYLDYGLDITRLVLDNSLDLTECYYLRKKRVLNTLEHAGKDFKKLVLADALSTLSGNQIEKKRWYAWYYHELIPLLYDLQSDSDTKGSYQAMITLYEQKFCTYYYEEDTNNLYKKDLAETYLSLYTKGKPSSVYLESFLSPHPREISYIVAKSLLDHWMNEVYEEVEEQKIVLLQDADRRLAIRIDEESFVIEGKNCGKNSQNGMRLSVEGEQRKKLLVTLKLSSGSTSDLTQILKEKFGWIDGMDRFIAFCRENQIYYHPIQILS